MGVDAHAHVLVLPGAGGIWIDGPQTNAVALSLAKSGFTAHVVSYFDRTGTWVAWGDKSMIAHFATWMRTIDDAIAQIGQFANHKHPIGIYGYSLGGFLAIVAGSRNRCVGAVVEQAGGIWDKFYDPVAPLPPVLVIHGRNDERVKFGINTDRIRQRVEREGNPFHLLAFENERHRLSREAQKMSVDAAADFFQKHLTSEVCC